jgi:hypothetical protein
MHISGQSVEYKYVIVRADGQTDWETSIQNRLFTPEGTNITLEDGRYNVERATLLNKDVSW